ncbi:MAG: DNA-binding transcriptional regulator [Sedimentisphaerales bacterium]|nr:DNA-binding transcriptional regulator [Sedimentisphaerales bacterium]
MANLKKVILLIENSTEFGRMLLRGIARYASLHGPWTFYREIPMYFHSGNSKRSLEWLMELPADGIIAREPQDKTLYKLGLPMVVMPYIKKRVDGYCNIIGDCMAVGRLGAEHLLDRGFQNFAFCGFHDMYWARERGEGFCQRIKQAGYEVSMFERPRSKTSVIRSATAWDKEQALMAAWLMEQPKPLGLMACNDIHSQLVIEACRLADLHVPEDVAIIGVDNDEEICRLSNPQLSSVSLNFEVTGYHTAEQLDELMSGRSESVQDIIYSPVSVITRQSTDILAIEDPEISRALRFIREHACEPIQVTDILEEVGASRRGLYQKFKRVLGRSVHDEIKRVRTDQIANLLVQTDMSISQIALKMGYKSVDHVSRYFHQAKGISPRKYRLKHRSK